MTSSDIEERKIALQKLPFDELAQMFGIQEEIDPEAMEDEVNELKKEELIDSIINHMMKNHHPITEERYQFVEWLYRIRALMETIMDSSSQTSSGSSSEK